MSMFEGLATWELITLSGLCAVGALSVTSVIGGTLAWWVGRERAPAPAPAPQAATVPAGRAPVHAAVA